MALDTGQTARDLLAEGSEALLQAAFCTGDYAIARARLNQAREVAHDRAVEAAIADRLGWLLHFEALDTTGTRHMPTRNWRCSNTR